MKLSTKLKPDSLFYLIAFAVLVSGLFIFLRSNIISNVIGGYVSEKVNRISTLHLGAGRFYINPFPLYVGAHDVALTDSDGLKVASFKKAKAYFDFTGLFSGRIGTHRIVLEEPVIDLTPGYYKSFLLGSEVPEDERRDGWQGVLIVRDGMFSYQTVDQVKPFKINGIDAEVSIGVSIWALFSISRLDYDIPGEKWPEISPAIKGRLKYGNTKLEIDALSAFVGDSVFRVGGVITKPGQAGMRGDLDITMLLKVSSLKESFGLVKNTNGEIRSEGTISIGESLKDTMLDIKLGGDFYLETLLDALRSTHRDQYAGHIECNGSLKGPIHDLKGRADAIISGSEIQGLNIDKAAAVVLYEENRINISQGKADIYGGTGDFDVSFSVLHHEPLSLSVGFRDVGSQPVFDRIHIGHIGLPGGKLKGELHSEGIVFSPEGWARFNGGTRDDTPLGRMNYFSGHFHSNDGVLMLDGFDLRSDRTQISFDGRIDLKGQSIGFDGYAISTDLSDVLFPYDYGLHAGGRMDISVKGTKIDPLINIEASLWDTSFRDYVLGQVAISADYQKNLLDIRQLKAEAYNSFHEAAGEIRFPAAGHLFDLKEPVFYLTARSEHSDLGGLVSVFVKDIEIEGDVDTTARLKGKLGDLDLEGKATVRNVTAYRRKVDSGSLDYYYKGNRLGIWNSQLIRDDSKVHIKGYWSPEGLYGLDASAENAWLSHLVPELRSADFKVNLTASGAGEVREPSLSLEARIVKGMFMNVPVHDGHLQAIIENGVASASLEMMNGNLSASGKAELKEEIPWELTLSLDYDRYDHIIRAFIPAIPKDAILAMGGKIWLNGDRQRINSKVRLKRANTTIYGQGFANIGPLEIDTNDKLISFRNASMRGAHASFDASGALEIGKMYDLALRADASLLPFARFMPSVSHLKGDTKVSVNIKGPWDRPVFNGKAEVLDGSVAFKDMPQRITSINSLVILDNNKVLVEKANARVGGGELQISGNLAMDGFSVKDINIETAMRNISARLSSHFNVDIDGFILLTGDGEKQDLNGEVAVKGALYRERMDWRKILLSHKAETPKGNIAWRENVKLNVRLYGYDNISIDNNLAAAPVRGDIFVKGTLASPVLSGRVEAVGGKVFFRNSELNIISATADYSDMSPSRPVIDISTKTDLKGYEIWLSIQGQADRMDLELASDPPLDDNEILALLAYGDVGSGYGALGSGLGTAEAASLVAGEIGLTGIMEERGTIYTGLDRIQIDPYLSRSTGSVTPRLTVSKKLLEDKLYLTYASTLDAASENEVKLEYLLGSNISLIGGQDYTGSVGGDLKFRFRFE